MLKVVRSRLPGLGQQRDDEARVDAAGQQHADRHVGDHAPLDRGAQRVEQGVLPVASLTSRARVGVAGERRVPVRRVGRCVPSGSTTRTVAGGSLRTPVRIVRGARDDRVEAHVVAPARSRSIEVSTPPPASSAGRRRGEAQPVGGAGRGRAA